MKRVLTIVVLLLSLTAQAQTHDWENPAVLGINKLPYHATLQLPSKWTECNEIVSLDGQWKFHWSRNPEERPVLVRRQLSRGPVHVAVVWHFPRGAVVGASAGAHRRLSGDCPARQKLHEGQRDSRHRHLQHCRLTSPVSSILVVVRGRTIPTASAAPSSGGTRCRYPNMRPNTSTRRTMDAGLT